MVNGVCPRFLRQGTVAGYLKPGQPFVPDPVSMSELAIYRCRTAFSVWRTFEHSSLFFKASLVVYPGKIKSDRFRGGIGRCRPQARITLISAPHAGHDTQNPNSPERGRQEHQDFLREPCALSTLNWHIDDSGIGLAWANSWWALANSNRSPRQITFFRCADSRRDQSFGFWLGRLTLLAQEKVECDGMRNHQQRYIRG